uniref:Protein kinase domain-containing protein n=1 Tax=Acrobeloides nanus TaxID=290746 RepID=A0A914BZC0_9BILA
MDYLKRSKLEVVLILIFVNLIRNIKNECLLKNDFIPEGCQQCIGNDFDDIFQIATCDYTYYKPISAYLARPTISRCDLGKRCTTKTQCQAKCEVVEKQECLLQTCVGNNCSTISHTTIKDGCVLCDGAWQIGKTDIMVCRSGELLKRSCPANKWCMSQGDCKARCEEVDTNGTITSVLTSTSYSKVGTNSSGTILAILVIIAFIIFLVILGACWYYKNRLAKHFNQNIVSDSNSIELNLRKLNSPSIPNMSQIRLITLNQLIIDKKKLGEGEFGAVYAVRTRKRMDKKTRRIGMQMGNFFIALEGLIPLNFQPSTENLQGPK